MDEFLSPVAAIDLGWADADGPGRLYVRRLDSALDVARPFGRQFGAERLREVADMGFEASDCESGIPGADDFDYGEMFALRTVCACAHNCEQVGPQRL